MVRVAGRLPDYVADVRDDYAALGGGINVDYVESHRHCRDALQAGIGVQDLRVDCRVA
jgi:hypothetical protein